MRLRTLATAVLLLSPTAAWADTPAPAEPTFEKDVRPILKAYCFQCHGEEEKPKAKLDLRLPSLMAAGGRSGPALVHGKPDESPLWERVESDEMPEGSKKLKPHEKAILKRWIAAGAKTARPEPANPDDLKITEEERAFWAFQPVRKPPVPAGAAHPIDAFVRRKLAEKGLTPSPEADRRTLARRAYIDLTGLPPTPAEVEAFANDPAPGAYEKLIDRLLASPHYGERWGRHWLDVAGYAESDGVTSVDWPRAHAWRYRDYVVKSFNADKPFDLFLREQIAGDELVRRPYRNLAPADADALTATGFLRMAPDATQTDDTPAERANAAAETIKVVGTAVLGLTVGCAQCHDHRYDPISQVDYHRLRAVFDPTFDLANWRKPADRLIDLRTDAERAVAEKVEAEAVRYERGVAATRWAYVQYAIGKHLRATAPAAEWWAAYAGHHTPHKKRTPEQVALVAKHKLDDISDSLTNFDKPGDEFFEKLKAKAADIRAAKPADAMVMAATELPGKVPESRLFFRGDPGQPKQAVTPAELPVLALSRPAAHIPPREPGRDTTGRRLAYARWLTGGDHPLTARVFVNRAWHHHFGRGIVGTPGDFGAFGERPSHPELLDWLAADFAGNGWSVKRLHKLVMTSATYKQSSRRLAEGNRLDPENRLLHRANVRRLEAEVIRDAILAHTGKLNRRSYGPSVSVCEGYDGMAVIGKRPVEPDGMFWGDITGVGDEQFRRSLYVEHRRRLPLPMLESFDLPVMRPNCDARRTSTVAPQSLLFLNSEFVLEQADALAARARAEAGAELEGQLRFVWREVYSADPTPAELAGAAAFVRGQAENLTEPPGAEKSEKPKKTRGGQGETAPAPARPPAELALASFCQTLLGTNRFLYVD